MKSTFVCVLVMLLFLGTSSPTVKPSALEVMNNVERVIAESKTLRMELERYERVGDEMIHGLITAKIQHSPYCLYVYNSDPNAGVEILFKKGLNGNKALVNPNGFPYMSLNLDPMGGHMRTGKTGHYTIFEIGYRYIGSVVRGIRKGNAARYPDALTLLSTEKFEGFDCYKVQLYKKDFAWIDYTVDDLTNVPRIARRLTVCEEMIVRNNDNVKDVWVKLKKGQVIKVPNTYCEKAIFWVDVKTFLPRQVQMFHEDELYEHYMYRNVELNTVITPEEFTRDYKDYNF
jgi:hypothetical protein